MQLINSKVVKESGKESYWDNADYLKGLLSRNEESWQSCVGEIGRSHTELLVKFLEEVGWLKNV